MGKSCREIAESLVACMKESQCVKNGGGIRDCMKNIEDDSVAGECQSYRNAYFTCKRGGLDMRTRIRGPRVY